MNSDTSIRSSRTLQIFAIITVNVLTTLRCSEGHFGEAPTDPSQLFTDEVLERRGWEPCVDDVPRSHCWRMFPKASTEDGCLSSVNVSLGGPEAAKDKAMTDGKKTTVVLERNGWYSQDLVNALAAVILQERMGYEVVIQEYGDMSSARSIVHHGQSHAVLEYWGMLRDLPESPPTHPGSPFPNVSQSWIGYKGQSGIFTNAFDALQDGDMLQRAYFDYYTEYARSDVVQQFVSNGVDPIPNTEEYLPAVCLQNQTVCGEVALTSMSWVDVILSNALLNNHNLKLVGKSVAKEDVYWEYIKRNLARRPMLYYAYFPSPFTAIKSAYDLAREERVVRKVHFPPLSLACAAQVEAALRQAAGAVTEDDLSNVTCGYPDNSLLKLTMPASLAHADLRRALTFLDSGLTLTQTEVDALILLYLPRVDQMAAATADQTLMMQRDAACEALKSGAVNTEKLLAAATRLPQAKKSSPLQFHQLTWFLLLTVSAIAFLVVAMMPVESFPTSWLRRKFRQMEGNQTVPGVTVCILLLYVGMYHETGLELTLRYPGAMRGVDVGMRITLGTLVANLVYQGITFLTNVFSSKAVTKMSTKYDYVLPMMQVVCKTVLAIVWFLWVLTMLGASTTWLLTTLSALILVIAFTLNDSIKNIIASVVLISEGNMKVGDWVTVGGQEGVVEEFSYRCTAIRGFDQKLNVVPNALVMASVLNNFFRAPFMRIDANVLVDADTNPATLNAFLTKIQANLIRMEDINQVLTCAVTKFSELGYQVTIACLTVHAPANSFYKKAPPWEWYQPFNKTRTRVATEVGQLLIEFAIDVAGKKVNLNSSMTQSIAVCNVDPSVRQHKVETTRRAIESAKHVTTQKPSVLKRVKVWAGVMGPLIYPPSEQCLQKWFAPAFHEVLPDIIAVTLTQCTYSPETRSNLKLRLALDDNSNDVTHLNAVSLLVAVLDGDYSLLAEARGGETSLVVFVRSELLGSARVVSKAATDLVTAVSGAACSVVSLGGIEVSVVAMGTKSQLIEHEEDFPTVLCEVVDRLELKPAVLSGADVLHAAPNVVFMGSLARHTDVFSDPHQQHAHLVHARDTLVQQILQGDCLSGFEFITRPNFSATMFLDDEDAQFSNSWQSVQFDEEEDNLKDPVSVIAPQMHAVLYSSPCGHIQSTQEIEMEANTAKIMNERGLGNPVASMISIRGTSSQGAQVNKAVQGLLTIKIEWMEGEGLMAGNQEGTSDPYVVFDSTVLFRKGAFKFGLVPRSDTKKFQTLVKLRTLNPKWTAKDCPELPTALSDIKGLRAHELLLICYSKRQLSVPDVLGQLRLPLKGLPHLLFDEPLLRGGCHMGRLRGKITVDVKTKSDPGAMSELQKERKKKNLGSGPRAVPTSRSSSETSTLHHVSSEASIQDVEKGAATSQDVSEHVKNKPSAIKGNRVHVFDDNTRHHVTFLS